MRFCACFDGVHGEQNHILAGGLLRRGCDAISVGVCTGFCNQFSYQPPDGLRHFSGDSCCDPGCFDCDVCQKPIAILAWRGLSGRTLLMTALRQLEVTPDQTDVVRTLLKAGADANGESDYELPLGVAVRVKGPAGPELVSLLLAAGANPSKTTSFGDPVYFQATGPEAIEALKVLLDHAANANALSRSNSTALFAAAICS